MLLKLFVFAFVLYNFETLANTDSEPFEYDEEPHDYEEDDEDYSESNSTKNGTLQFTRELANVTKHSGKNVTLRCEAREVAVDRNQTKKASRMQFKWLQNFAEIKENAKFRIKNKPHASLLKIINLEPSDRGIYGCEITNGIDKITSEGTLNVTGGNLAVGISDFAISFGNGESDLTTFNPTFTKTKSEFEPLSSDADDAKAIMHNFHKTKNKEPPYNASEPFCQVYKGNICNKLLANRYVFIQPPYTQKMIEEKLSEAVLVVSQSNEISTSCNHFAMPSLCFSAFPICSDYMAINSHQKQFINKYYIKNIEKRNVFKSIRKQLTKWLQRICKEECYLLENELCSKEYSIAKRHPLIGPVLELEECDNLPDNAEDNGWSCLKLGVESTTNVDKEDTCYWDNGALYRGVHDTSESGLKCIRWSHQFQIPLSEYPELTGHSYCRNPGGKETEPFCFIEASKKEVCGIRKCARIVWIIVTASVCGFIFTVLCVLLFCCRKKSSAARSLKNMNVPSADKNIYGNGGPSSPIELSTLLPGNIPPARNHHPHNKTNYQNVPHYTYKEVNFVEELGEGAFGKVYKGELKMKAGKIFVAVKSLKENANAKTQADFQREIELISELKHTNIICLLGVVMKQEPMCMIFEYMSEGDLHEFLIANSPNEGKCLSQIQFLQIAIQIAQGMEYLSENHYVHRDLAARNCLVSNDLVVKISDFGLSRDMYSCDYYRVQSKSLLPVRWMPPESILYGKFTTESDVWSYGVVLWEIYSYGLQPYYGYNNQEVINMIRSRKLLPCPDACPSYCYALMVECWAELAIRRPSFAEICHRLRVWKQNGCSTGAYFKTPDNYNANSMRGHSSKSSHTTDSQTLCPMASGIAGGSSCLDGQNNDNATASTWERGLQKTSVNKLNLSQSSLTSHSSSLGNKTQSTNLSDQNTRHSRKSIDRKSTKSNHRTNDGAFDSSKANNKNFIGKNNENSFVHSNI